MPKSATRSPAELVQIYQCFCDETRLRIINLLRHGPLCVCHFQELLDEPQVRISKQLGYLKSKGLVQCVRQRNWMIYSLPAKPGHELDTSLSCLQECANTYPIFKQDLQRRRAMASKLAWLDEVEDCCGVRTTERKTARLPTFPAESRGVIAEERAG